MISFRIQLRYANNSNYKNDEIITREVFLSPSVIEEFKKIVVDSEVSGCFPSQLASRSGKNQQLRNNIFSPAPLQMSSASLLTEL